MYQLMELISTFTKNVNIGMAAALPDGNLIVPVIKECQNKNLIGITKSVNDLAKELDQVN